MKKLLLVFVLFTNILYAQQVSVPESKTYLPSTNGQDGSGFVLSGFTSTSTLLTSISLVNPPSGTTFNLTTTTGLSPASGFTLSGNKTRLVFTGTQQNINNALASLKINTGSVKGSVQISVAATINPAGYFYNGVNGHFYRPISTGATYVNAITLSSQQTFKGQQGYLVTITSADEDQFIFNNVPQSNIWFAADDRATEGRWVISAGPEAGRLLRIGNASGTNQQGVYNNWAPGEPNDWGGNEDAAVTKWGGGNQWNDLSTANVNPYVVEFGTWTNPDDATFTEFYTNSVIHTNGDVLRIQFNFDFASSIDETKFSTKMFTYTDFQTGPFVESKAGTTYTFLNGLGRVDMTNSVDATQIGLKSHAILFDSYNQTQLQTLYNQIVTVSDVYLAFKEYSDRGLFGNESKHFTSGVQFQTADVDNNNIFDERDCYLLLQHLHGTSNLLEPTSLNSVMKLFPKSVYDGLTKSNWNSYGVNDFLGAKFPITITPNVLNSYNVSVSWKGDVNLSHSSTPVGTLQVASLSTDKNINHTNNDVITDIMMERQDDEVVAIIVVNPNGNQIGATQFDVYFDNTKLEYKTLQSTTTQSSNFARNNGSVISVGSLNTSGGSISNIGYKVIFKPKETVGNLLGLISVKNVETLNTSLNKINIKIE